MAWEVGGLARLRGLCGESLSELIEVKRASSWVAGRVTALANAVASAVTTNLAGGLILEHGGTREGKAPVGRGRAASTTAEQGDGHVDVNGELTDCDRERAELHLIGGPRSPCWNACPSAHTG